MSSARLTFPCTMSSIAFARSRSKPMFTSCSVSASQLLPPAVPGLDPAPVGGRTGPVPAPNSPKPLPPAAAPSSLLPLPPIHSVNASVQGRASA